MLYKKSRHCADHLRNSVIKVLTKLAPLRTASIIPAVNAAQFNLAKKRNVNLLLITYNFDC